MSRGSRSTLIIVPARWRGSKSVDSKMRWPKGGVGVKPEGETPDPPGGRNPYVMPSRSSTIPPMNWQQLVQEVNTCHAIANGIPARPKTAQFNSLCVFSFQTKREQVGQKQKSFTCRVTGHDAPKPDNWKGFFVGYDTEVKNLVWDSLQPSLPLIAPTPTLALPESVDF